MALYSKPWTVRNKSEEHMTRVDVLFKNVAYVKLATIFDNLEINEVEVDAISNIKEQLGVLDISDRYIYMLKGINCNGYVVAGSVITHEDTGEYFEPSELIQE